MRLISQDGKGDMPYEGFVFGCHGGMIIAARDILGSAKSVIAQYSSEEKAMKVLEMVRNAYAGVILFQNVEVTEEAMEILKKSKLQGIISATDEKSNVEYIGNTVFRFPKDSEVEV